MQLTTLLLSLAATLTAVQATGPVIDADYCNRVYVASNGCSYNVTCGYRIPRRIAATYSGTAIGLLKCTDQATTADPSILCTDFDEETEVCSGFTESMCLSTRAKGRYYKMAQEASCPDS